MIKAASIRGARRNTFEPEANTSSEVSETEEKKEDSDDED